VAVGRLRLAAAPPGDGVDSESLAEDRFDELPIGVVIAERTVDKD